MTEKGLFIYPDWPAPDNIKAFTTTRQGGVSFSPYDAFNLGDHVADSPADVQKNRDILITMAGLPSQPKWLTQVHGTRVIDSQHWQTGEEADAIFCQQPDDVCAILTADCLPVLLCNQSGSQIAAIHAGWRGLLNGIIEKTLTHFSTEPSTTIAWLGPAIGPQQFEVGKEVFDAFTHIDTQAEQAFKQIDNEHYLADIYQLARQRLQNHGVTQIYGGNHCTVSEPVQFYSYRRDGQTGRMASIIWIENK